MIPKRAFFFWGGPGPMSWLRRQSIETFCRLNPEWDVDLFYRPGKNPVHRSDLFRYIELYSEGGYYFDTDIVFLRPFPEKYLDADVAITITDELRFASIGVLGASRHSQFFLDAFNSATARKNAPSYKPEDYQHLGVGVLNRMFMDEMNLRHPDPGNCPDSFEIASKRYPEDKWVNLPYDLVMPVDSFSIPSLYTKSMSSPGIHRDVIGVHWFGGYPQSKEFERSPEDWPMCYMNHVLEMSECLTPAR